MNALDAVVSVKQCHRVMSSAWTLPPVTDVFGPLMDVSLSKRFLICQNTASHSENCSMDLLLLCSVQCAVGSVKCVVGSVKCVVYNLQWAVFNKKWAVYWVHLHVQCTTYVEFNKQFPRYWAYLQYAAFLYLVEAAKNRLHSPNSKLPNKNPAYGRQRISRPMRIVGPIQFWRGCVIYL